MRKSFFSSSLLVLLALTLTIGCAPLFGRKALPLGDQATGGGIGYRVQDVRWAHQLTAADGRKLTPRRDFLVLTVELENLSGEPLPAGKLPRLPLVDEHGERYLPLTDEKGLLPGSLLAPESPWAPGQKLPGKVIYDVYQVLYWLQPDGTPPLYLGCWWQERIGD
jgi:hypothetical protein